jgi:DNA-binding beta-propeller fold protein YncE
MRLKSWFWCVLLALSVILAACKAQPRGLQRPNGVAVAADGSLFVMDFGNHRVVHLTDTGKLIGNFGHFGTRLGQIYNGSDMAVGPDGKLYFTNMIRGDEGTYHDGVVVFSPDGRFLREIGGEDYPSGSDTTPNLPYGIDVDREGRVYTADFGVNAIRVFDAQGQLIASLSDGTLEGLHFISVSDVVVDDQRQLMYIIDSTGSSLIQLGMKSDAAGELTFTYLLSVGQYGRGPGELIFPQYITVDERSGYIYVSDMANRRLQVFSSQGAYITDFTPLKVKECQLLGAAVGEDGTIYVADSFNNTLWVFTLDGQFLRQVEVH